MKDEYRKNFIRKCKALHGDKYDYSEINYINSYTPLTIKCPWSGHFMVNPRVHSCGKRKQGCPKCDSNNFRYAARRVESFENFVLRAKAKHGDKYIYQPSGYTKMRDIAVIICPKHGEFKQEAKFHVKSAHGCRKCYYENRKGTGVGKYSEDYFIRFPDRKNKNAELYLVSLDLLDGEKCLKVGIVHNRTVKQRFARKKIYHNMNHITSLTMSLYEAYQYEQKILNEVAKYKIKTELRFSGYTECFNINKHTIKTVNTYFGININIPEINHET